VAQNIKPQKIHQKSY